ncbi:saccharopine dehydrogenase family protein [Streptomyces meridianus]|uniref:Saccharopine dehydrogenase NADP-binding domain-containing protein n=1 Tax=Streptomyces meridianus TaxID=2938945 RepID=A0ABT0XBK3_9ACTN|nr:saccharopine dehydrogenase NADP-binding domain-containing protein [Streptomyces meridianus]MCM2579898.1 saccharopine dehydrogenase NADP-binding domain-containing protein [Streptomyces meridianus]
MRRTYDLVLYGATGFTGGLTAEYLARHAPAGCRWALAGRDPAKLEALRSRLERINPDCAELPLLHADSADPASLRALASGTRVVATTVGPYLTHGEPLVAACADAGTHYADLSGEPEFVDRMYLHHHARAQETGARLVHACGFDSVPHDLGVHYTVGLLPEDVPLRVDAFVRSNATFSGGTLASALTAMSRPLGTVRTARARRGSETRPPGRRARAPLGPPVHRRDLGVWAVPLPTIDPQIVERSAAALERYGPDFRYRHYAAVKWLPVAVGGVAGTAGLFAMAQIPPARRWLSRRLEPGTGPGPDRRARSWFTVRFVAEGGGKRVVTEVSGGDPGYEETAKMLAESAICLAFDDLPPASGQVTTAVAMGDALTGRLTAAGLNFRVIRCG